MEFVYMTETGLSKLKEELHDLKYIKRPVVSEKIATAREHGDLKENAEYHAAREELSFLETKIMRLQDSIARARTIDESEIGTDEISILNSVTVKDLKRKKEYIYTLVASEEVDVKQNRISISSPVGKGLIGKKVGDVAEIQVPAGLLRYEILAIEKI